MIYLGFALVGIWALGATVLLIIAVQRSGRNEKALKGVLRQITGAPKESINGWYDKL